MANILSKLSSLFTHNTSLTQEAILGYFKEAAEKKTIIFLDFFHANQVIYQANARCISSSALAICLELRFEKQYIPAKNMELSCYFVITKDKKDLPCLMTTKVIEGRRDDEEDSIFITIKPPETVTHTQRRSNVRVPLSEKDIPNFQISFGQEIDTTENGERRRKIVWNAIDEENVKLVDISAGGLMVILSRQAEVAPLVKPNSFFLCSGNFCRQNQPRISLLLVAKVCRISHSMNEKHITLGLQFQRWTQVSDTGTDWREVIEEEGINPISKWLFPLISKLNLAKKD